MCENNQKRKLEPEPWKKRAPEPEPHSWKPTAPEAKPEVCHFYYGSAALKNPRC